jgi:hypothetical protein
MRPHQLEGVLERTALPGAVGRVVAELAGGGEARRLMVGVRRPLVVGEVAADTLRRKPW